MQFDSIIARRKSVRSFKDKKPSWKFILDAIESANQGPFAGNRNNLKFIIIESLENIKALAKFAEQHWIAESSIVVIICSDDTHLENLYGERGRIYSRQQAGAATQTILLKLTDLGLSSCWVGSYTDEVIKEKLNIPQHIQIEAIIPIGYESQEKEKKPRKKELESSIFWEKWNQQKRPPLFEEPKDKLALKS